MLKIMLKPIIEELVDKVFEINLDNINEKFQKEN